MWLAFLGLWTAVALTVFLIPRLHSPVSDSGNGAAAAGDTFLVVAAAVSQQGWSPPSAPATNHDQSVTSIRMAVFTAALSGLILFIPYSAGLVSMLSISINPIDSLSDLIRYQFDIRSNLHIPTANTVVTVE